MSEARTNTLDIHTPEGISFSLLLAGPLTRFFAWAIDLACILVLTSFSSEILYTLNILNRDIAVAVIVLVYFAMSIGYGILLEWHWRGQTLGKRLLGLRVVDAEGLRLQFNQVVIRNLLRFVDAIPALYLVGGVASVLSSRSQRLGDIAANTVVIRSRPGLLYDIEELGSEKYNSFREYPHLEVRLRQHVSPDLAGLALHAVQRREHLEPAARIELFKEIADHFRLLVPFPEEATYGMTDEQYVRNVVDSLFHKQWRESLKKVS
jgi:uncharacterized RDD family membrane protein YckC